MSILRDVDPLWTDEEDLAKRLGRKAGRAGEKFDANPYPYASKLWDAWNDGYFATTPRRRPLDPSLKPSPVEDEAFQRPRSPEKIGYCIVCGRTLRANDSGFRDGGTCLICDLCAD